VAETFVRALPESIKKVLGGVKGRAADGSIGGFQRP